MNADISDLTLHGGRKLVVEIGDAVLPTPTLNRRLGGASSVTFDVHDPELRWLQLGLLSERFDATIDGLDFRYVGCAKSSKTLSLTLEDRDVARLRELKGPKKAFRAKTTRAEFIVSLVRELRPAPPIYVPELHVKQPIRKESEGKKAKKEADENRERGLGDVSGLTVKGIKATKAQIDAGDRALRVAASLDAPFRVMVGLMAALMEESVLGDAASNWLQLIPSTASASGIDPTDLEASVHGFLTGYIDGEQGAIGYYKENPSALAYEIAQAVQKSGAGEGSNGAANYGPRIAESREWVEAFDGAGAIEGDGESVSIAYTFEVGKKENYWEAIQRLAKEVNWRAFFVAGRFFYIAEDDLIRSKVRFAINPDTPGIEDVDFNWDRNKAVTEVTVSAYAKMWVAPPGSVVTLEGYGPASLGFGSAPVDPDKKGRKAGISGNRKAKTGEGRARYLVSKIEVPLTGKGEARLATITLRKPTSPLGEPPAETKSRTPDIRGDTASGDMPPEVQRMLDFAEGEVGKPYLWAAYGPDAYDCSGFVSRVLNVGGFLEGRLTTSGLASWGVAGEGEWVTVHDKVGTGSSRTEHVLIEIAGEMFECGGISGGVGRPDYSASALAEFSTKRHPKGY